jgi:hypothetical protein
MYAPQSHVAAGLQLSQSDRAEIARAVSPWTDQRIALIYPGTDKDSIDVTCGYLDELSDGQRITGDAFTLKKINGRWAVIDKGSWMR